MNIDTNRSNLALRFPGNTSLRILQKLFDEARKRVVKLGGVSQNQGKPDPREVWNELEEALGPNFFGPNQWKELGITSSKLPRPPFSVDFLRRKCELDSTRSHAEVGSLVIIPPGLDLDTFIRKVNVVCEVNTIRPLFDLKSLTRSLEGCVHLAFAEPRASFVYTNFETYGEDMKLTDNTNDMFRLRRAGVSELCMAIGMSFLATGRRLPDNLCIETSDKGLNGYPIIIQDSADGITISRNLSGVGLPGRRGLVRAYAREVRSGLELALDFLNSMSSKRVYDSRPDGLF